MISGNLLSIEPTELKFDFELRRQSSCSMQLTNNTDKFVAFKVKTTSPKRYAVRPNTGIVLPRTTSNVIVRMQAQNGEQSGMLWKDKFLIQSVVAPDGTTVEDIRPDMFLKDGKKVVEELKLRVVCVPANPQLPVIDESNAKPAVIDAVSTSSTDSKQNSLEAWSIISKLTEEKTSALQQNQKLHQELELRRKDMSKNAGDFHLLFVALILLSVVCPPPPKAVSSPPSYPNKPAKCPKDTLKFGVCGSWLGLVKEVIGTKPSKECCTLITGLADLEAAMCLCTAIKANVLGAIKLKIPIALSLVINACGKKVPEGFLCA